MCNDLDKKDPADESHFFRHDSLFQYKNIVPMHYSLHVLIILQRKNSHEAHHPVGVRISLSYAAIRMYCPTLMRNLIPTS